MTFFLLIPLSKFSHRYREDLEKYTIRHVWFGSALIGPFPSGGANGAEDVRFVSLSIIFVRKDGSPNSPIWSRAASHSSLVTPPLSCNYGSFWSNTRLLCLEVVWASPAMLSLGSYHVFFFFLQYSSCLRSNKSPTCLSVPY